MASTELHVTNAVPARRAGEGANAWNSINVGYSERMASAVGGPLLALYGLTRGSAGGLVLALIGGELFYRGMTGHCPVYQALGVNTAQGQGGALHIQKSVTINRPREELYQFWRDFENLPRFMKHLKSVTVSQEQRSHWIVNGPAGSTVEWDAEITEDRPNQLIAWRSLEGAQVDNTGTVRFEPAPGDRGTVVRVAFDYNPPAGVLGAAVAKLFGEEPNQQVEGDLRRFKNLMEAGELPTTEGQPAGKRSAIGALLKPDQKPDQAETVVPDQPKKPFQPKKPPVQEASEESFPASDPPAWTGTGAGSNEREVGAQ